MLKTLTVGAFCELRVYSAGRIEIYDCTVVELQGAACARVKLAHNGNILRVIQNQIKVIGG